MRLFLFLFFTTVLVFGQQDSNLKKIKKNIYKEGIKAYKNKNSTELTKKRKEIYQLFIKTKDSLFLAKFYHFKALENRLLFNNDSAFYYYYKSQKISEILKDSLNVGRRLLSIASMQNNIKDYLGSDISAVTALSYLENIQAYKYIARVYNILGIVSQKKGEIKEAIYYYNKALDNNKKIEDKRNSLFVLNNLGLLYQSEDLHEKALPFFIKGLQHPNLKSDHPDIYNLLLENLAISNLSLGKEEKVLDQFNEVLNIRKSQNSERLLGSIYLNIGDYYRKKNQLFKAILNTKKALTYAKKTHNNAKYLKALGELSVLTKGEESKKYFQEYITLNDSLIKHERRLKNQFAKIRYETDKKEKENTLLKIKNEKNVAEITYHKQQKIIGWLLFLASLLVLGFGVLFYFSRKRKLIYENKLQKIQAREEERQQIAKSLHDEVAGDLRMLHQKLQKSEFYEEAEKLEIVKENVRVLSHQLNSVSFQKVSFKDQIVNLVADYFEPNFKIKVIGIHNYEWEEINNSIKRLLYLSLRECIQNCQKHAKATKVVVDFSIHKKNVFLSITDNGIGFNSNKNKKGIGLQNLEERLKELNGVFTIDSDTNKGAEVYIQIPLNVEKNKITFR